MNDITKHKWCAKSALIGKITVLQANASWIEILINDGNRVEARITKPDAIAIARHFNLIDSAILHGKRISNKLGNYEEEFIGDGKPLAPKHAEMMGKAYDEAFKKGLEG